jgi:hypothetical protein
MPVTMETKNWAGRQEREVSATSLKENPASRLPGVSAGAMLDDLITRKLVTLLVVLIVVMVVSLICTRYELALLHEQARCHRNLMHVLRTATRHS